MHKEEISYLFVYLKALIVQTQGEKKCLLEQADPCDWEGRAHPGIDGLHSAVCYVFASDSLDKVRREDHRAMLSSLLCHVLAVYEMHTVGGRQDHGDFYHLGFPGQQRKHSDKVGNVPHSLQPSPRPWQSSGGAAQVADGSWMA